MPIKHVNKNINKKKIINNISKINNFFKFKLKKNPKFAVLGLNPHCETTDRKSEEKIFDLLEEIIRDLKNYEIEFRIEELESKFSKDLNESTFNEIRELKKMQKIN